MKSINVKVLKFKWPNKKRHLEIPLYGGAFYVCTEREEYKQIFDFLTTTKEGTEFIDGCLGCVTPLTNEAGGAVYLIGIFDGDYGTLCHEVGHLALFILDRAGVPVDAENSEAFCYLQGHLFDVCQPIIDEANLKTAEEELAAAAEKGEPVDEKAAALVEAVKAPEKPSKPSKDKGGKRDRS
jgi:hypothetical protein